MKTTIKKGSKLLLAELAAETDLKKALGVVKKLEAEGFKWRAVGDRESNYGVINIGSDPGIALVERITNAIDAVLEREALRVQGTKKAKAVPASPREAAQVWLKVPGGRVANLGEKERQKLAENVVVTLWDGLEKLRPTVQIRDLGVGLTPRLVPLTILSLQGSNKIDKHYLAGAFGQGGSTVLAFSPEGTTIVSRRQPDLIPDEDSDEIAVTFARFNELDPAVNKNGRYEFLVTPENDVAAIDPKDMPDFEPGTSVVHFNMGVQKYGQQLTQPTGSLWWLFQNALFDPMLPFWAEDRRSGSRTFVLPHSQDVEAPSPSPS